MGASEDLAALVAALPGRTYKLGSVPPGPTYPYRVVSLAPDAPVVRDLGGSGDPAGRFVVQHFGRSLESVIETADDTFDTFDGKALPLAGEPVAWQEIASSVYRDPDTSGVLDVTQTYRY